MSKIVAMLVALMVGVGSVTAFAADETKPESTAPAKRITHKKPKHEAVKKHTVKHKVVTTEGMAK